MDSLTLKELEDRLAASEAEIKRLQSDAAEERAAIDAVKQLKQQHKPSNLFNTLSQEIRDMIWGYCVAPGKVFVAKCKDGGDVRFKDFSEYEMPHLALLATDKSIRNQAAKILFEKNHFMFTHVSPHNRRHFLFDDGFDDSDDEAAVVTLTRLAQIHLRSASVAFDLRSPTLYSVLDTAGVMRDSRFLGPVPWSQLTRDQKVSYAHDSTIKHTHFTAHQLMVALMYECTSLRTLELDFTNAYCQLGCCRVVSALTDTIASKTYWWPEHFILRVLGLKNKQERDSFIHAVSAGTQKAGSVITVIFEKFEVPKSMFGDRVVPRPALDRLAEEDLDKELSKEVVHIEVDMDDE